MITEEAYAELRQRANKYVIDEESEAVLKGGELTEERMAWLVKHFNERLDKFTAIRCRECGKRIKE